MSPLRQTAEYWRQRAEEARREAHEAKDPDARHALLKIADLCDQLADEAARSSNPPQD
jgi:hypothetical protein